MPGTTLPMIQPGQLALLQFDDWFIAPDGSEYKAAYGPVNIIKAEDLLGFVPKGDTNWYVQIGYDDKAILLAGCRVHSASPTTTFPSRPGVVWDAR